MWRALVLESVNTPMLQRRWRLERRCRTAMATKASYSSKAQKPSARDGVANSCGLRGGCFD
jgi:hypothetical protein